jgi:hypothetical protein
LQQQQQHAFIHAQPFYRQRDRMSDQLAAWGVSADDVARDLTLLTHDRQRAYLEMAEAAELEDQRIEKMTFVVLVFAVHLALQDSLAAGSSSLAAPLTADEKEAQQLRAAAAARGAGGGRGGEYADPSANISFLPSGGDSGLREGQNFVAGPLHTLTQPTPHGAYRMGPAGAAGTSNSQKGAPSTRFPSHAARRPNVQSIVDAASVGPAVQTDAVKEQAALAYDRFDSAFRMVMQFAQMYAKRSQMEQFEAALAGGSAAGRVSEAALATVAENYSPAGEGLVMRQSASLRAQQDRQQSATSMKVWSVSDMRESDLFYFAVPFDEVADASVRAVIERAHRHVAFLRKSLVTAPSRQRGRRWLLVDMVNNIMPRAIELLERLASLLVLHGSRTVRFPLFLFREKELHMGERAIHPGNLVEVLDQICFYFSQRPADVVAGGPATGGFAGGGGPTATSNEPDVIQKLEERIRRIQQQQPLHVAGFGGGGTAFGMAPSGGGGGLTGGRYGGYGAEEQQRQQPPRWSSPPSDEDDDLGPGHGGLSSDSD